MGDPSKWGEIQDVDLRDKLEMNEEAIQKWKDALKVYEDGVKKRKTDLLNESNLKEIEWRFDDDPKFADPAIWPMIPKEIYKQKWSLNRHQRSKWKEMTQSIAKEDGAIKMTVDTICLLLGEDPNDGVKVFKTTGRRSRTTFASKIGKFDHEAIPPKVMLKLVDLKDDFDANGVWNYDEVNTQLPETGAALYKWIEAVLGAVEDQLQSERELREKRVDLLTKWKLTEYEQEIEEFVVDNDYRDPVIWPMIPKDIYKGEWGLNSEQRKKWKDMLKALGPKQLDQEQKVKESESKLAVPPSNAQDDEDTVDGDHTQTEERGIVEEEPTLTESISD